VNGRYFGDVNNFREYDLPRLLIVPERRGQVVRPAG
jgi:hypothetical protein